MKNFWIRTASATVYAALMIAMIYLAQWLPAYGWYVMVGFFLLVSLGGVFEFYRMAETKGIRPYRLAGYCFATLLYLNNVILMQDWSCLLPVVLVIIMMALFRKGGNPFEEIGVTLLAPLYVALPLSLLPWIDFAAPGLVMMVVILIWVNDACAYMGGSLIGKHKLWSRHSPGKTWEGCGVGLFFAVVASVIGGPVLYGEFPWWAWMCVAVVCSVIGTLGDLAESMFKRACGVKDSGKIMPGHGGILDRFDSILACMPFVFLIYYFIN